VEYPLKLEKAIELTAKLPSVGKKSASRMILSMMKWTAAERESFAESIVELNNLKTCKHCGLYTEIDICSICNDEARQEQGVICVVESLTDLFAIEKSQEYKGTYHILGGVLNPLLGVGPEQLRIEQLEKRCQERKVNTLILAISPSVEGDATCSYLKSILPNIQIERIGFGVPMGGSLEYLDSMTISKALENRREFS